MWLVFHWVEQRAEKMVVMKALSRYLEIHSDATKAGQMAVNWDVMIPKDAMMAESTAGQMVVRKAQWK